MEHSETLIELFLLSSGHFNDILALFFPQPWNNSITNCGMVSTVCMSGYMAPHILSYYVCMSGNMHILSYYCSSRVIINDCPFSFCYLIESTLFSYWVIGVKIFMYVGHLMENEWFLTNFYNMKAARKPKLRYFWIIS